MTNVLDRLMHLNSWFPTGSAIWGDSVAFRMKGFAGVSTSLGKGFEKL